MAQLAETPILPQPAAHAHQVEEAPSPRRKVMTQQSQKWYVEELPAIAGGEGRAAEVDLTI